MIILEIIEHDDLLRRREGSIYVEVAMYILEKWSVRCNTRPLRLTMHMEKLAPAGRLSASN